MESVLESHGPCESLERSIVQIGLGTAELRVERETQLDTVVGGRFHAVESLKFQYDSTNRMLRVIILSTDIHPRRRPAPPPTAQSAAAVSAEEEPDDADRLTEADETVPVNCLAEMLAVSFTFGHFGKIVVLSTDAITQTVTFKVKKDTTNARHTLPAGAVYAAYDRAVYGY